MNTGIYRLDAVGASVYLLLAACVAKSAHFRALQP